MDIADFFMKAFPQDFPSKSSVRRAIVNKGLRINDVIVDDPFAVWEMANHKGHAIGLLLEKQETIVTSFLDLKVIRHKEPFEGWGDEKPLEGC